MIPVSSSPPIADLYRLERTPAGDRLVPVVGQEAATHANISLLRRVLNAQARDSASLHAEIERLRNRAEDLEAQRARDQEIAAQTQASIARLLAKNQALIAEKRRLRDALIGKHPLPTVHYRIDIDRDGIARESLVEVLDTFPHKDRTGEALREARRLAERKNGAVRSVRLDSAWRAVIERVIEA